MLGFGKDFGAVRAQLNSSENKNTDNEKEKEKDTERERETNMSINTTSSPDLSTNNTVTSISLASSFKPLKKSFVVPNEGEYRLMNAYFHSENRAISNPTSSSSSSAPSKLARRRGSRISFISLTALPSSSSSLINSKETKNIDNGEENKNSETGLYFLINCFDAIHWCKYHKLPVSDLREKQKFTEPNLKFRQTPLCHDFNTLSSNAKDGAELLVGFASGDILFHEPLFKSVTLQFNKDHCISNGSVTDIKWIPASRNLFLVSFTTGDAFMFDKLREDQAFSEPIVDINGFSVFEQTNDKINPVSRWHLSKQAINEFRFSPMNGEFLAVAGQDGYLRVYHFKQKRWIVGFRSYYGGVLCVNWSPDEEFIVSGGEDDLLCIWSFKNKQLVARAAGHQSFVSRVTFDAYSYEHRLHYRIGSVGQDTRLLLWDLDCKSISAHLNQLGSASSKYSSTSVTNSSHSNSTNENPNGPTIIAASTGNCIPIIEPTLNHRVHAEPVSDVHFLEDCIVTSCWNGISKFWARPLHCSKIKDLLDQLDEVASHNSNSSAINATNSSNSTNSANKTS